MAFPVELAGNTCSHSHSLCFWGKNKPLVRYLMVWHWIWFCPVTSAWKQAVSGLEKVSPLRRRFHFRTFFNRHFKPGGAGILLGLLRGDNLKLNLNLKESFKGDVFL